MMDVRRATVAGGRLRVDFDGLKAWRDSLSGHATSEPLLRYLPKAELVLKRAIPALIVAFLFVVAASHFFGMMSEYGRLEASARHATALSAATASAVFADAADIFDNGDMTEAQARLAKFLPQDRLDSGAFVLLVQASGKVFAATTAGLSHVGSNVGDGLSTTAASTTMASHS